MSCIVAKDGSSSGLETAALSMDPVQHSEMSTLAVINDQASQDLRVALQHEHMAPRVIAITFCSVLADQAHVSHPWHKLVAFANSSGRFETPGTPSGSTTSPQTPCIHSVHMSYDTNQESSHAQQEVPLSRAIEECTQVSQRTCGHSTCSPSAVLEKASMEAGRAVLDVIFVLEQQQRPTSKAQYFKGDRRHRARLRLWQALCVLLPFAAPGKLGKLLGDVVAALHHFDLASVKQYQERGASTSRYRCSAHC
jgi:hypothetical protein